MSELFDDHSPLQLGVQGRLDGALTQPVAQGGLGVSGPFMLIGRLQYRYEEGVWNEWHLLLDDGNRAWLSEDNGSYALTRDLGERTGLPLPQRFQAGQAFRLDGTAYSIASITEARLIAAAGELPFAPELNKPFWIVEARSAEGSIASLDYSAGASEDSARLYVGRPVALSALALTGLKDESAKSVSGRGLNCPNCGSGIEVKLDGSKSITCGSCAAVVDLTQQEDGKPAFTKQSQRFVSPIPLGTTGTIDGISWQAVGFARRSGVDNDGERFSWGEVLLYNRLEGFAFVVVASDAVSFVRPVQDVPNQPAFTSVRYKNRQYKGEPNYKASVDYVEGEFYWQVRIGQITRNLDYSSGELILSREESVSKQSREVVWSHGRKYKVPELAKAFGQPDISQAPYQGSPLLAADGPLAGTGAGALTGAGLGTAANAAPTSGSWGTWIIILIVFLMLIAIIASIDDDDDGGVRSSSGGYGRSSSGGHK